MISPHKRHLSRYIGDTSYVISVYKARYLVQAHLIEGRSVSELAKAHGVHRSWIYKLIARAQTYPNY